MKRQKENEIFEKVLGKIPNKRKWNFRVLHAKPVACHFGVGSNFIFIGFEYVFVSGKDEVLKLNKKHG